MNEQIHRKGAQLAVPLAVILADNKDGLIEGIFFESALEVFKFGLAFGF